MKQYIQLPLLIIIIFTLLNPYQIIHTETLAESNKIFFQNIHLEIIEDRFFLWVKPQQEPTNEGYPMLFLFHGASQHAFSWILPINKWNKYQMSFTADALDQGFFLILLESNRPIRPGPRAWDVFTANNSENNDISYVQAILSWLNNSQLPVNMNSVFCAGFSSGAFMCSRLALNKEHLFNAIALNSGCNADSITLTNRGPQFDLYSSYNLSVNHPPTLLLHGQKDQLVPVQSAINYYQDLTNASVETQLWIASSQGHIWLSIYNTEILNWFNQHA